MMAMETKGRNGDGDFSHLGLWSGGRARMGGEDRDLRLGFRFGSGDQLGGRE